MIWLDLANAYGSVRHSLIRFALEWYHFPEPFIKLLLDYYDGINLFVKTKEWCSDWFPLRIGVAQGCTASTIIFYVVFQLVLDIHAFLIADLKMGFTVSKSNITITAPAFADMSSW